MSSSITINHNLTANLLSRLAALYPNEKISFSPLVLDPGDFQAYVFLIVNNKKSHLKLTESFLDTLGTNQSLFDDLVSICCMEIENFSDPLGKIIDEIRKEIYEDPFNIIL